MTDKQQPEALRLADALERPGYGWHSTPAQCAAELRRLHAELETLRAKLKTYEDLGDAADDVQLLRMGYAAARLEIESLKSQVAPAQDGIEYVRADRAMRAAHPACKPDMLVNAGALKLALNVLRRAGKDEVADELEKTAQPAPAAVAGPSDSAIPGRLGYSALMRLADENGLGPNNVSGKLQARIELYGRAVERAAIRAQQQIAAAPTTQPEPQQEAQHLAQALTDPENQPNQYSVEFGMSGPQMHFKIGNQLFKLAYEPDEQEEFEFMKRMLINAFSIFTPDVKSAPQPSPAAQGDALDAARYRMVRRGQRWSVIDGIGNDLRADALDAAIDAARAAQEGK